MRSGCFEWQGAVVILRCHASPSAKRNKVIGVAAQGYLKIKITTPSEDGQANLSLRKYLAFFK